MARDPTLRDMSGPLLAVDAPSLLYRAWFALPDSIRDGAGRPVNALLGATNMVLAVIAERAPRVVVMCRGPESARYRVEAFPEYHAARPEMPAGLASQWAEAPDFFEAFGWEWADHGELEADDLMHSYALVEEEAGGRALILTGDRDMYQCATDRTLVLYIKTGVKGVEEVDPAEVERRYGVPPALVPDFIALRGDPSDGIPGAKGIGEKGAADLLRRHGSLEGALERCLRETPRVRAALHEQGDVLRMYKDLATLRRIEVARPPDRRTDLAGGGAAAEARGMNALAKRLRA
jgi:5'-3' exonuclease